eukprot:jgi/Chlat1/3168/Chrsp22S03405
MVNYPHPTDPPWLQDSACREARRTNATWGTLAVDAFAALAGSGASIKGSSPAGSNLPCEINNAADQNKLAYLFCTTIEPRG